MSNATTIAAPKVATTFNARTFALAWLNAAVASATDPDRPYVNKVVCVEQYSDRVQFVATDSYLMLRTVAPATNWKRDDSAGDLFPDADELPLNLVAVVDTIGLGAAFFKGVLTLTKSDDEEDAIFPLKVKITSAEKKNVPTLDPSLDRKHITFEACEQKVTLPLLDLPGGLWVDWRSVDLGLPEQLARIEGMRFSPLLFARLGKLKGALAVETEFTESEGAIRITFPFGPYGSDLARGVVMPMRADKWKSAAAQAETDPETPAPDADPE